ncbi:hypothetical protein Cgig2_031341 [Carnegiea gigantea]|uniref:Uncharacterized protein n=1 Tax=Carnegiea gigantea TaxID=171969 RepID=A0A9Q1K8F0_9CARY|nr:hypothetical protein Cgig2_031341 [Carnegiea gigantea]
MEVEENKINDEIDAMLMEKFQMFNDLCMGEVGLDSSRSIEFEKEANDEAKKLYRCKNSNEHQYSAKTIEDHLIAYEILPSYTFWCHHGQTVGENQLESESLGFHNGNKDEFNEMEAEENKIDDEIDAILMEKFQMFNDLCMGEVGLDSSRSIEFEKEANDEAKKLYRLFEDLQQPLYEGCKASKLPTVVKLLHNALILMTFLLSSREIYAAEFVEKYNQTRGVTKKAKSATHVTLQPLSQMDKGDTSSPTMKRKRNPNARPRGINLVKEVARLKDGEKLGVEFYNNGVVSDNSKSFSKHLGKLIRDRTMCPIRVHSWDEIQPEYLETMWVAVLIEKCFGTQDHNHVVCFGHGVTAKDVWGPQSSKVDLMVEIQEKNQQIN